MNLVIKEMMMKILNFRNVKKSVLMLYSSNISSTFQSFHFHWCIFSWKGIDWLKKCKVRFEWNICSYYQQFLKNCLFNVEWYFEKIANKDNLSVFLLLLLFLFGCLSFSILNICLTNGFYFFNNLIFIPFSKHIQDVIHQF